MKSRALKELGIPQGDILKMAQRQIGEAARGGLKKRKLRELVNRVALDPAEHLDDPWFGELAQALVDHAARSDSFEERDAPAPWRMWGDDLDEKSIQQLRDACRLPVAVSGALMPDAHLGYGLPIGGVLACDNAVIPYAVGVDIACRMRLTVLDMPVSEIRGSEKKLINTIEEETRFGIGASFRDPRDHAVMDEDWEQTQLLRQLKGKARAQLGTSGSGNHFVEFGELTLEEPDLGLAPGTYLALLSHSGSRGAGAKVANTYSRKAMQAHPELPKELKRLAWLDLDSELGQEYWVSMQLMGQYAAANHAVIHREIVRSLRAKVLAEVENHHNFAWKEEHGGREVVVHRKGATPAGEGVLGIIPGSMATPGYVVRGRGEPTSLRSASHGAGRVMSRRKARESFTWSDTRKLLTERGVTLISADLDEVPGVYKDIEEVMGAQQDLVDVVARFDPKIVKMAPPGEPPED